MAEDLNLRLIIDAINRSGGAFRQLDGQARDAQGRFMATAKSGQGIGISVASGMIQAQAAIGLVTSAVGSLQSALMSAADIQLSNVNAASTFASLTGESYDNAASFVEKFNDRMAKSAASLPGATADYTQLGRTIMDSVVPAFQDMNGKIQDMTGLENTLAKITESYTAIGAASGVDSGNVAMGLTKAMAGSSIGELRQIQIFEQNPVLLNALEQGLKDAGAEAFKDLDIAERVRIVQEAGEKLITEDFKRNASRSVSGLMATLESNLFDPTSGVFGLMRDTDDKLKGNQSAFAAFNDMLDALVGTDGLYSQFARIAEMLNLPDPMAILRSGLLAATTFIKNVNGYLAQFKDVNTLIGDFFNKKLVGAYAAVSQGGTDNTVGNIRSFFDNAIKGVGTFMKGAFDYTMNLMKNVDFTNLGFQIGTIIGELFGGLMRTLASVDMGAVLGIALAALSATFQLIVGILQGFGVSIVQALPGIAATALSSVVRNLTSFWNALTTIFGDLFKELLNLANTIRRSMASFMAGLAANIPVVGGSVSAAISAGVEGKRTGIDSRYAGYIPNVVPAATGLFSAALIENLNKPVGSSLVVANSSEAILTPAMLRNLVNNSIAVGATRAAGASGRVYAPVFNISGNDPKTIAKEVLNLFEQFVDQEENAMLAIG